MPVTGSPPVRLRRGLPQKGARVKGQLWTARAGWCVPIACAVAVVACLANAPAARAGDATELELYVDVETKQVFAEPGPNRVRLGVFKRVDTPAAAPEPAEGATAPSAAGERAPAADTARAVPEGEVAPRTDAQIEARQRQLEERLEQMAASLPKPPAAPKEKKWYDAISLRGYTQVRISDTLSGDKDIRLWNDATIGEDRNFGFRRIRLIFSGFLGEHLFLYLQPDFASSAGDTGNIAQVRDAYGDIFFDARKEYRLRVGQSKVPYSFENLQSSQNRLSIERNDALNSCCQSERDLGAFFYYSPQKAAAMFRDLVRTGLKGSGDYGVFALGVYNGQGANGREQNDNLHVVSRVTYPHQFGSGQFVEAGVQAYSGWFVPTATGGVRSAGNYKDERIGLHAVLYPQPFGLQAEWNWGVGPELNAARTAIETQSLHGGYVQAVYKIDNLNGTRMWIPYVKYQYYHGGIKFLSNAPFTKVSDWEFGVEWRPDPAVEITLQYHNMNRNDVTRAPFNRFSSDVLRLQVQLNY